MHFDYNNVYESYAVNIFKNRPLKNLNRGALAGAGSAFGHTCSVTQDYDVCQLQRNTAQFHRWDTGALFLLGFPRTFTRNSEWNVSLCMPRVCVSTCTACIFSRPVKDFLHIYGHAIIIYCVKKYFTDRIHFGVSIETNI